MTKLQQHTRSFYDWQELCQEVELKSGKSLEDWFGKYKNEPSKKDYKEGNFQAAKFAVVNGWDWKVLNDPVDEAGMKERVRIMTLYNSLNEDVNKIRYCRFWSYANDYIFFEVFNGSIHYFNPSEALAAVDDLDADGNSQEWVREILRTFIEVFEENGMPNKVQVEISW